MKAFAFALLLLPLLAFAQAEKKGRVVLRWKPTPGATNYQVQVASDALFKQVIVDVKVNDPVLKWESLPSATLFWRVRSFDGESRPSEWSASRTIAAATGTATLRAPADGATLYCSDEGVKLEAEPQAGLKSYQLEVSNDVRFPDPKVESSADGSAVFKLAPGSWLWRARATDTTGHVTGYSEANHLSLKLSSPRLKNVPDLPTGIATVALEWSPVPCARGYVIDAVHEAGEHTTLHESGTRLSFKPALAGVYKWKVAALDERGVAGEYAPEGSFSVRTAAPFTKGEQVGAVTQKGREIELRWLPAPNADTYLLEISVDDRFREPVVKQSVVGTVAKLTLAPGLYWWRVTGKDKKDHLSFPSEPRRLVVPEPPNPQEPKLLAPMADVLVPRAIDGKLPVAFSLGRDTDHIELELDGQPVGTFKASPVYLPDVEEGDHTVRIRAVAPWGTMSEFTKLRAFHFGSPPSTTMEISVESTPVPLDGETKVKVHLTDEMGRPVMGRLPKLKPAAGHTSEPKRVGDSFVFTYYAPSELPPGGSDELKVRDLTLSQSEPIPISTGYKPFSVAAWAGLAVNGASVTSPSLALEASLRPPALAGKLELAAQLGFYFATTRVKVGSDAIYGDAELFPLTVLLGYHAQFGDYSVRVLAGGGLEVAAWRLGLDSGGGVAPAVEGVVGGGRDLGPGRLEVQLSVLYGHLEAGTVTMNSAVFGVALGYRFGLGRGELAR